MADKTEKTSYTRLIVGCAAAALVGFAACYYFALPDWCPDCPECPECPICPVVEPVAYFDTDDVDAMCGLTDATGVRFYLASPTSGSFSVLAGPYKSDGTHIADASGALSFGLYERLSGEYADLKSLDEAAAIDAVTLASSETKPGWSIDASCGVLRTLLATSDCNGLGLVERNTTDGTWTFDLVPVQILDGRATVVGFIEEMAVGAPCPMYCGRDESVFLHRRTAE
jgi:hypothetical protein